MADAPEHGDSTSFDENFEIIPPIGAAGQGPFFANTDLIVRGLTLIRADIKFIPAIQGLILNQSFSEIFAKKIPCPGGCPAQPGAR
jgi:hypothetical protein